MVQHSLVLVDASKGRPLGQIDGEIRFRVVAGQ
jgi:hypothetical protein